MATESLTVAVTEVGPSAWLDLLEREHGYVIARARLEAERRREVVNENDIDAAVAAIKGEG